MLNIISEVNNYLNSKITLYSTVIQNVFMNQSSEEIICREEPSEITSYYYNNSYDTNINFAYYIKSNDMKKARDQAFEILDILAVADMNSITGGKFVSLRAITPPSFLEKTQSGEFIFTLRFVLNYIGG